jgi:glycosyltransferase involved in cell wall biosynthesis
MRKLNVLIICPFFRPNVGGVETHLDDLCEYLRTHNYKVYVLTYQPLTTKARGLKIEKKENLEIRRIWWPGFNLFHKLEPYPILEFLYLTPGLFLNTFFFLLNNRKKVDVIHAQGFNAAFISKILSRIFRKKFIVSTHAIYGLNPQSFMAKMVKWTLGSADKILALSKPSKEELIKIGVTSDKIDVYHYWVDQTVFKPINKNNAKKQLGWNGKFVVLFVGRLIEKKGVNILLEVARQTLRDIYFAFIGDGPLAEEIKRASGEIPNVLFIGKINNRDLPLYYNAADIFCIPSQYEEGFGRVILEAISCGTPVVGSSKGGIPEAVDSTVGILVEPRIKNLKGVIEKLYKDKEKLEILSSNCRKYAEEKFGEKNAEVIVDAYAGVT